MTDQGIFPRSKKLSKRFSKVIHVSPCHVWSISVRQGARLVAGVEGHRSHEAPRHRGDQGGGRSGGRPQRSVGGGARPDDSRRQTRQTSHQTGVLRGNGSFTLPETDLGTDSDLDFYCVQK